MAAPPPGVHTHKQDHQRIIIQRACLFTDLFQWKTAHGLQLKILTYSQKEHVFPNNLSFYQIGDQISVTFCIFSLLDIVCWILTITFKQSKNFWQISRNALMKAFKRFDIRVQKYIEIQVYIWQDVSRQFVLDFQLPHNFGEVTFFLPRSSAFIGL